MSASFGPVNMGHPRFGECLQCWDENWSRRTAGYFDSSRVRMRGAVCGHRLEAPRKAEPQFKVNAVADRLREEYPRYRTDYWSVRALQPDHCGERGELVCGTAANVIYTEGARLAQPSDAGELIPGTAANVRRVKKLRRQAED